MSARLFAATLLVAGISWAADDVPPWLKDAAGATISQYGPKVKTVVLFNEEHVTAGDAGKLSTTTRTAIRILARQGVNIAFFEQYDSASGKVRDFRAWMIGPAGKVKKYGKEEMLDVACAENDVYNECRRRFVSGTKDAEPGSVFGYEATVESQTFSNQVQFHFQDSSPVRLARLLVTAPPGWELKATPFNGAPREAVASGGTYSWQMENLAPMEPEDASPSFLSLAPWVGVNLLAPGGKRPAATWAEAAKQLSQLNEGQSEPNDALVAKAKALTEGAASELDKIRALGRFAQQVNYVSIQVDISKGGGYRPHPAAQVFQKLYGDCKDKANLMRALLKAVGITAYPVAIYAGDRTHVTAEWPSLGAFNHAISAIRVGPGTNAPAVADHPKMGRLLFFDPTDPYVPPGHLPDHEQASLALVGVGEEGDLMRVPAAVSVAPERERHVEAVMKADGGIDGSFTENRKGEAFAQTISVYRGISKADYVKRVERWVGGSVQGATVSGIEMQDNRNEFVLKGSFASPSFAQRPQPRMLIFRAALLRHSELRLTEKTRKYPIVLDTDALDEVVRIQLPMEFKVDELPDPVQLESPFGKFEASWTVEMGWLIFKRSFEMQAQTVEPAKYGDLKKFLDSISGAADSPVVLIR